MTGTLRYLLGLLILSGLPLVFAADKPLVKVAAPALEPVCVVIEPKLLRTATAHVFPGAKNTILTPASELKSGVKLLDDESWKALGMEWPTFLAKAKEAAARHLASLTPEVHKDARGTVEYVKYTSERHLTSSIILCPDLLKQVSPLLGTTIVALVPDRFTVYLFPRQSGAFVKQGPAVATLFTDAIYPASDEAFEISENGIKSIGNFTTGDSE
jgi:hypothetical protein